MRAKRAWKGGVSRRESTPLAPPDTPFTDRLSPVCSPYAGTNGNAIFEYFEFECELPSKHDENHRRCHHHCLQ